MIALFLVTCLATAGINPPGGPCTEPAIVHAGDYPTDLDCRLARNTATSEWAKRYPERVVVRSDCTEMGK